MIHIKIGSAPTNNVVLNHPSVSPFHLEIVQDDKRNYLLTDLNSLYGTTVNGYRIQGMVQLRPTDIVKAGELVLPWNSYFQYQTPVTPAANIYSPTEATVQPNYTSPIGAPVVPEKPRNKKKILFIIGGGVLASILILVAVIYFYTRPSYKHLKLIPSDAFVVMSIDVKSIAGKVDLDKLQQLDFFRNMKKEARGENDALSKAMSDPMSSGIDIFSQPYAFSTAENGDRMRFTGGIVFAIKNESDFRSFIKRASQDESVKQSDNFSLIRLGSGACIAWNDDAGVMIFSDKSKSRTENYCRTLFELSHKESINSVESFSKFKTAKYDIGFYVNYDALRGIRGINIPAYMDGSASMITINFNEGKLSYTNEYLPTSADPNFDKSFVDKKGINDALKNSIPGKSYGIASLSLDMDEIYKFMNSDPQYGRVLDELSANLFLQRKQLTEILTGDFCISLADIKQMPVTKMDYQYNYEQNNYTFVERTDTALMPGYIFGATAKNVTLAEGVFRHLEGRDTTNGIRFWSSNRRGNSYVVHNGSNYFFTNDFSLATSLSKGKASVTVSDPMSSIISKKPLYSYFNLNLSKYPAELTTYLEQSMGRRDFSNFELATNIFDYAEYIGDGSSQTLDIYLVDKKTNCLNKFLETANELYLNRTKY